MPQRDPKTGRYITSKQECPPITRFQLPERATLFQRRCRAKAPFTGERCLFRRDHVSEHGAQLDYGMSWWS